MSKNKNKYLLIVRLTSSSETEGQLVGAGKSLTGAKKIRAKKKKTFLRPNFFSPV